MDIKKILAIGGSDPSGGAGVQADSKTLVEIGVYPYTAITAVTAQNSMGVSTYEVLAAKMLRDQIDSILDDGVVHGVKTGMLGSSENIQEAVNVITENEIKYSVIDPVIKANDGRLLVSEASIAVLKKRLIPSCFMITPNIYETNLLTGMEIFTEEDFSKAAEAIKQMGAKWVLIKGGHLCGDSAIDFLFDGKNEYYFETAKIRHRNVRGTGCMMASAICAYLVKGLEPYDAVDKAKAYVHKKIKRAVLLGKGSLQAMHFCIEGELSEDRIDQ